MQLFILEITNPLQIRLKNFSSWDEAVKEAGEWAGSASHRVSEISEEIARRIFPKIQIE